MAIRDANLLTGPGLDEIFARTVSGTTTSYLTDGLGSVVALGDETGSLTTQYTYEPYGKTTATGAASDNAQQYTGRENDGTGLYYYRNRYYLPECGRFISEDPIGIAGGMNLYQYVGGDPISARDPTGNCGWTDAIVGFGDAFGAGLIRSALGIGNGDVDVNGGWYGFGGLSGALWGLGMVGAGTVGGALRIELGNWKQAGQWVFTEGSKGWHFHWGSGPGLDTHHLPYQAANWLRNLTSLIKNGNARADLANLGGIGLGAAGVPGGLGVAVGGGGGGNGGGCP